MDKLEMTPEQQLAFGLRRKMYSRLYSHQHLIVLYPDGIITLSEGEIP